MQQRRWLNLGNRRRKYIPDIANILKDEKVSSSVRSGAAQALAKFGEPAAKYIPDIANILKDEKVSSSVRSDAAEALAKFGEPAAKYIPDIANILKDEKVSSSVRSDAAEALAKFGEPAAKYIPDILNFLKDEKVSSSVRSDAAEALAKFGEPAAKYIPDILNFLKDEKVDYNLRFGAAQALAKFGEPAAKYIPDILNFLKDEKVDYNLRFGAAQALANFGEPAAKYIPDILNFLKDEKVDSYVRSRAAEALANFGEAAAKYIPDILNFLKDEKVDSYVRSRAAEALANFGEAAAKYIPDILNFLKDEKVDSYVRSGAAQALANFGEPAAKYIPDIANILKDEKVSSSVRSGAAQALANFGEPAAKYIPDIANILKDEKVSSSVRSGAAQALANFGEPAAKYIPDILNFLKDEKVSSSVRSGASQALANFGEPAAKYIPDIANILKDEKVSSSVRSGAAQALANFGEPAAKYIPDIANILKDEKVDYKVRSGAAQALANFGEAAAKYIPDILNFLKDEKVDYKVRSGAAQALANFGEAAAKYIPDILNFLKDEKVDYKVRKSTAEASANFRQLKLGEVVVVLNNLYYASHLESKRWRFLTYLTGGGTKEVKTLLKWLGKPDKPPETIQYDEAKKTLEVFQQIWEPTEGLREIRKDLARNTGIIVKEESVTWKPQDISWLQVHYSNLKTAGYNDADTVRRVINNLELWKWFFRARNIILIHLSIWLALILAYPKFTQVFAPLFWNPWLRRILGFGYIGLLLTLVPWLRERLLQPFKPLLLADAGLDNFVEQAYFTKSYVKVSRGSIPVLRRNQNLRRNKEVTVIAPIGSNPRILRLLHYAGAPFAMTSRFLRRGVIVIATTGSNPRILRLLRYACAPLAMTNSFWRKRSQQETDSPNKNSPDNITPEVQPITQAIPTLKGQIVLEGESGLGKSMFLRHLAHNSQRLFVYLPAHKCDKGVIKAIYGKLRGHINDAKFLKNLIYNGALDICIDGLNEVTADTRAKISQFAESYFQGNIIMTTQPLDWIPPSTAKKYELQPLEREQIQQFLILRGRLATGDWRLGTGEDRAVGCVTPQANAPSQQNQPANAPSEGFGALGHSSVTHPTYEEEAFGALGHSSVTHPTYEEETFGALGLTSVTHPTEYEEACSRYLAEAFNEQQSTEDLAATKRILSNPMDLTLVALMLSQGQQPNLFRLQEQQYQLMAAEYQREHQREFPLKRFSEAVYHMLLNDETIIPSEEFKPELTCLEDEKYKMVISRQWENDKGEVQKKWYFRYKKIMDFFLAQNFLAESQEAKTRLFDRINDPRFRGVYFLLASLLPLEEAKELREKLIDYATDTNNYTLMRKFVQLLRLRPNTLNHLLKQQKENTKFEHITIQFLEQVGATIKREQELYLTVETIESSLNNYAPFPILITVNTPTDENISRLVKISQKLKTESTTELTTAGSQKAGLLIYKLPPDPTARMEIAKVRLRDNFLLIPIPIASVEKALDDKYNCIGLLEEYIDRYVQHADFFDDRNAITDTLSFFGRTEILQRLGEELLRYQSVGLFGLRKSGKTSVLIQLGFMLREHPIVHIDLQTYSGSRYAAALFNKILDSLSTLGQSISGKYTSGQSTLDNETRFPQFEPFALDKPAAEVTAEFIQRVNEFVRLIQKNYKSKNHTSNNHTSNNHTSKNHKYKLPILCFLDEVERIIPTPEDDREKAEEFNAFFGALRVLCQERKISLLVADVHPDCNRINSWTQTGVATNPVFSFFKEIFLPPFSKEETQDMLVNLGELMGLEFDAATPQEIHHQSGGHPFVSRQIARFLTNKIKDRQDLPHQNGSMLIEWGMVEKYLEKTLTQKGQLKNYLEKSIWEDLEKRNFQVAIWVLQTIACNEDYRKRVTQAALFNQLKSHFSINQLLNACNWLINVGLLYEEEVDERELKSQELKSQELYRIRIPLLSGWIYMQMTEEEIEQCRIL